jgi:hypothetical protein
VTGVWEARATDGRRGAMVAGWLERAPLPAPLREHGVRGDVYGVRGDVSVMPRDGGEGGGARAGGGRVRGRGGVRRRRRWLPPARRLTLTSARPPGRRRRRRLRGCDGCPQRRRPVPRPFTAGRLRAGGAGSARAAPSGALKDSFTASAASASFHVTPPPRRPGPSLATRLGVLPMRRAGGGSRVALWQEPLLGQVGRAWLRQSFGSALTQPSRCQCLTPTSSLRPRVSTAVDG